MRFFRFAVQACLFGAVFPAVRRCFGLRPFAPEQPLQLAAEREGLLWNAPVMPDRDEPGPSAQRRAWWEFCGDRDDGRDHELQPQQHRVADGVPHLARAQQA